MTTRSSRVGFGRGSFGSFRFGIGDWPETIFWNYLPEIYKVKDSERPKHELRGFIDSIKPPFQDLRESIESFLDLRDPARVPIRLLPFLANDVGLVDDPGQVESRRRSAVFDAFLLFLNKGTEKGYTIIGAFNNVVVAVETLWEGPADSGNFGSAPPNMFILSFDDVPADFFGEKVNAKTYRGNRSVAQLNSIGPASGDAYVLTNSGALTSGTLVVGVGDLVRFDGANWVMVARNVGGFPDNGIRAHIANLGTLQPPLTTVADNGKIATWGGASLAPTLEASLDEGFFEDFFINGGESVFQLRFTNASEPLLLSVDSVLLSESQQMLAAVGQTVFTLPFNGLSEPRLYSVGEVKKNGVRLRAGTEFSTDIVAGTITLNSGAAQGDVIGYGAILQSIASFTPNLATGQVTILPPTSFEEFLAAGTETFFALQFSSTSTPTLQSVVSVVRDGSTLTVGVDYTVDLVNGRVNLTTPAVTNEIYRIVEKTDGAVRGKRYRIRTSVNINTDAILTDEYALWPIPLHSAPYVTSSGIAESYIGNRTVAQINALSAPLQLDAYVVTDTGTITLGALGATVGDLVGFFDGVWKLLAKNDGGFPPIGTLARTSRATALVAPLTNGVDTGRVVQWDGTSLTPIFIGALSIDNYLGNLTVSDIDSLVGPKNDDCYCVANGGTLDAGPLTVFAGDIVRFNGSVWSLVVANSGGSPPLGTLARVSLGGTLVSPLVDGDDNGKLARWTGATTSPTLLSSFSVRQTFEQAESPLQLRYNDSTLPRLVAVDAIAKNGKPITAGSDYTVEPISGRVVLTVAPVAADKFVVLMEVQGPKSRTNRLRLHLTRVTGAQSELPAGTDEIVAKIVEFKPAHVTLDGFTYDADVPLSFAPSVTLEIP